MNIFEKYVYPMFKNEFPQCLSQEECPAIKAERNGKIAEDICAICSQCWGTISQKSR